MTAEIAIMNRTAVVLAADSATTVTSWKDGVQEKRYFKGANKLFELSRSGPVGLMIYGSAGLQGVPWELPIKAFRDHLGAEQFDSLETYPARFFDFVQHNDKLFTQETKEQALVSLIGSAVHRLQMLIAQEAGLEKIAHLKRLSDEDVEITLAAVEQQVEDLPIGDLVTEADIANATAKVAHDFIAAAPDAVGLFQNAPGRQHLVERFVRTLIRYAVKEFCRFADTTGVVVAGYGKEDYFPTLDVYQCYGFLGDRLIFSRQPVRVMDASSPAVIQPFATTSMIDTFRMGVAPDVFDAVYGSTTHSLIDFGASVMAECGAQIPISDERLREMIEEAHSKHTDRWCQEIRNQHVFPLSNIIHSLPLPDMAGLAKSLIELESLKERVTKPSESVSGPIDVAVISKHDGFVWIDRKHYFKPELNPRFFKRPE
ncbi:hypothetical protein V2J81_05945 [Pseudomonas alliivorans]|nr:hypothetical protein [Pseudomonas alliivorans]